MKYREVYEMWALEYKHEVRESTYSRTTKLFENHILPDFGDLEITEIKTIQCKMLSNELLVKLVAYKQVFGYFSAIFDYAVMNEIMDENPCRKVVLPKKRYGEDNTYKRADEENYWNKYELSDFLEEAKNYRNKNAFPFFRILAYTGMRKGEALALQWKDIDFKRNTIDVNKTLSKGLDGKTIVQPPKTKSGYRLINIDQMTADILADFKATKISYADDNSFIFLNMSNDITDPKIPTYWMNTICQRAGVKKITIHGIRHTHATLLLLAKASVQEVQHRLGHANYAITMNIYAHVTKESKEEVANKFLDYMGA